MTVIIVLGWLLVIWLLFSAIYSTKFHLGNYLLQRQRINAKEVGEVYKSLHDEMNWGLLWFLQAIKLAIASLVVYLLLK